MTDVQTDIRLYPCYRVIDLPIKSRAGSLNRLESQVPMPASIPLTK